MTRDAISLTIPDVSAFTRSLRREAAAGETGHQAWLNRVARAAGYRNFQHLSATRKGAAPPADEKKVARALRYFGPEGRLARWPKRSGVQQLCLWPIWAALPKDTAFSERQISARIDELTEFRDAAVVRRVMVEMGLMSRRRDGSDYRRIEQPPPSDALALIRAVGARAMA